MNHTLVCVHEEKKEELKVYPKKDRQIKRKHTSKKRNNMTSILSNDNNNITTENTSNNPFAALLSSLNNSIQIVNEAKNNNVGYEVDNNNNDEYKLVRSIVLSVADTMENTSTRGHRCTRTIVLMSVLTCWSQIKNLTCLRT